VVEPLRVLPIAGILPLTILWCGIGETQKVAALFLGTVFFLLVAVASAIEAVEPTYLSLSATLGATGWQRIRKVLVPAAGPAIWEASRNLYGVVFSYLLVAEAVASEYGLGALTIAAQRRQHIDQVFALLVVILALGYGSDVALKRLGRFLYPWSEMP
jgi:NitT/TauT family transport system permease protein